MEQRSTNVFSFFSNTFCSLLVLCFNLLHFQHFLNIFCLFASDHFAVLLCTWGKFKTQTFFFVKRRWKPRSRFSKSVHFFFIKFVKKTKSLVGITVWFVSVQNFGNEHNLNFGRSFRISLFLFLVSLIGISCVCVSEWVISP